jgi:RNA-directed DNA polymerase
MSELQNTAFQKTISYENLYNAWLHVQGNDGCAGSDGITISVYEDKLEDNLRLLQNQLANFSYNPSPLLPFKIPKRTGQNREINISTVQDRIVQQALLQILESSFSIKFCDNSYAYRRGKSAQKAIKRVEHYLLNGNEYFVKTDIKDFFPSVDVTLLLSMLSRDCSDEKLLRLVKLILYHPKRKGLIQGSILAPFFSNVYMTPFDMEMQNLGYNMIRYADDSAPRKWYQEAVATS